MRVYSDLSALVDVCVGPVVLCILLFLFFLSRMAKSPPELPALRSDKLLDRMSEGGLADNNNNNYNADNAEAYNAEAYNGQIAEVCLILLANYPLMLAVAQENTTQTTARDAC